jgi:glycosyltransferase involved in cell wall biosynthesis
MIESGQAVLPLISIIVVTYNSATTVKETLDSLLQQDYPALEILVCDDGSNDLTPNMVQVWIKRYGHLFKRAVLLQSSVNEGICKNINKGYKAAKGDWLKPIAGDDLIAPKAMRKFAAIAAETDLDVIVALIESFGVEMREGLILPDLKDITLIADTSDSLRIELITRNPIPAPSALIRRSAFESVDGIDLSFKHLDDWPLWIRFAEAGKNFGILNEVLVRYRVSDASISKSSLATSVNSDYLQDLVTFYGKYQRPYLSFLRRWDRAISIFRWKLAIGFLRLHPNLYKGTRLLHTISPCAWVNVLSRWK